MRCNIIDPTRLTDQHIIAERRELRMIPPLLEKRARTRSPITGDIPKRFCLGTGHQIFWLDKFLYLEKRFNALGDEMENRGFNPNRDNIFNVKTALHYGLYNDWLPKPEDYDLIIARIREKIEMKFEWYRYKSQPITRYWFECNYPIPYF